MHLDHLAAGRRAEDRDVAADGEVLAASVRIILARTTAGGGGGVAAPRVSCTPPPAAALATSVSVSALPKVSDPPE